MLELAHFQMERPSMDSQRHMSPDGKLCLIVVTVDDDLIIGFEGYGWHTHGDILARLSGLDAEAAIEQFIEKIKRGELVIAVLSKGENVTNIWISDDPQRETVIPGETILFRLWNGQHVVGAPGDS
jgi:hypothetical protein